MVLEDTGLQIAVVYLGRKIPRYVISNLKYLTREFPEHRVWLITDSKKVFDKNLKKQFRIWLYEEEEPTWEVLEENHNYPKNFRGGFWFLTFKRFKVLEAFIQATGIEPVLHLEADVFLMPNFPFSRFSAISTDLVFPMVSPGYGIASTLFIKDLQAIKNFNSYIETEVDRDSNLIDMTLLGKFAEEHPEKVTVLPSGPTSIGATDGFFDGAAFGTYLLGQDPRNFRGISPKYSPIEWHSDQVGLLDYEITGDRLFASLKDKKFLIYSLHLHSKNPKLFNIKKIIKELNISIREHKMGVKKKFAPRVLPELIVSALVRRVKKANRNG